MYFVSATNNPLRGGKRAKLIQSQAFSSFTGSVIMIITTCIDTGIDNRAGSTDLS